MLKTKIFGTGAYVPSRVMTNDEFAKIVDTDDEWIVTRTGIRERRIAAKDEACSDLAFNAARRALESANVSAEDLDMIILATLTPDKRLPASACLLQDKLGATKASVFDIDAACSGFVFGLSIADQYVKTGAAKRILVVGSEVMSRVMDWEDRATCILFGDGAGAAVLGPATDSERLLLSTHLFSNGSLHHLLNIPGGGSALEWTAESLARKDHLIKMSGREVFKIAVNSMAKASQIALDKAGYSAEDVDMLIPHQANMRIIKAISKKLNFPMEKVYVNLDKYGNTSAASIPIALDEAVRGGTIKEGDLVLLATFGAGFAWASALVRW